MPEKTFHISDILSVTTGALLSESGMDGVQNIMSHIVGGQVISMIGMAANAEKAQQFLEESMPWLKDVNFPDLPESLNREERIAAVQNFVQAAADKYGAYHQVGQLAVKPDLGAEADRAYFEKRRKNARGPGRI